MLALATKFLKRVIISNQLMTEDTFALIRKVIKVHNKIKKRQFNSLQDGIRLVSLETAILKSIMFEISNDLLTRNNRFFRS